MSILIIGQNKNLEILQDNLHVSYDL